MWKTIAGNDSAKAYLQNRIRTGTVPHAMLFCGPKNAAKEAIAHIFAQELVGSFKNHHPDIHLFRPEGKSGMHSIQTLRAFSEMVYMAPFEGTKKIFIICDAHRMLPSGANALLKTFEEPAVDSVIILISDKPEEIIETVRSRCQTVRFSAPDTTEKSLKMTPLQIQVLEALSQEAFRFYPALVDFTKDVAASIEKTLESDGAALTKQLLEPFQESPTAQQKAMIEKEVEASITAQKLDTAKQIFDLVLHWHRDLHLLSLGCDPKHLFLKDQRTLLEAALKKGRIPPMEAVEKAIKEALLSLERSTSLQIALEGFLLKILA